MIAIFGALKAWLEEKRRKGLEPREYGFLAVLALALALRLTGITHCLSSTVNSDEPYFVNVAVYFGGGNLNPPTLKYPTLWPYTLFAAFGGLFALWSGFGLIHSVREFGEAFAWDPSLFYLTGRLAACLFSLLALPAVYLGARVLWDGKTALLATLLIAVSPDLSLAAHYAKWDSMAFFWGALAWYFALKIYAEGKRRHYALCGAALGLCASTHYAGGFSAVLLVAAHLARAASVEKSRMAGALLDGRLWVGLAAIPAGFLTGTPYAVLDFAGLRQSLADIRQFEAMTTVGVVRWRNAGLILASVMDFAGAWPAALCALAGFLFLLRDNAPLALVLAAPLLAHVAYLSGNGQSLFMRFYYPCLPALAMLAACGAERLSRWARSKAAYPLVCAAVAGPGLWRSAAQDYRLLLPDTRFVSAGWIEKNIPAGSTLLMDQPHASPFLHTSREQAEELYRRTSRIGHPRAKYYELLRDGHKGGGYWIYRIQRSAEDLAAAPGHHEFSEKGYDLLDISAGLRSLKAAGIQYVVATGEGIDPVKVPAAGRFFEELSRRGTLVRTFVPEKNRIEGPVVSIYRAP